MRYIHESDDWTNFKWDSQRLSKLLGDVRYKQGLLLGKMNGLGFGARMEANIEMLTADAVKSNLIEGETIDPKQVRSSLARRLGANIGGIVPVDRNIEGIVEIMLDAVQHNQEPLTQARLFGWHAALFPMGYSGLRKITTASWRTEKSGDMRVVSGIAREHVHFEAPPAGRVEGEMKKFLDWFNAPCSIDGILKAGIAHFWFITIHPFEDGNGRIARTIADMSLARAENSTERFYSVSVCIEKERSSYYEILERSQKGDSDITEWLEWFIVCLGKAVESSGDILASVIKKSLFWQTANMRSLNERQRYVLNRLLDGFTGKLTSSKYAAFCKCSQDTALRDIRELLSFGLLVQGESGGRSTEYKLTPS
ncbi:MAG: Fic family protein [Synergistaceae bacterium]|nr:Fic family protein [Synergistaceae bacterium]